MLACSPLRFARPKLSAVFGRSTSTAPPRASRARLSARSKYLLFASGGAEGRSKGTLYPSLFRSYIVFTLCSIPPIVDHAPEILSGLSYVPGIRQITEYFIKQSFFAQFVGGETVNDTIPILSQLRDEGKGVLLAYSVEVNDARIPASTDDIAHRRNLLEISRSIESAGDFEDGRISKGSSKGKTWVAVKLTALLPSAESLRRFSTYLCQTRPKERLALPYPYTPHADDMAVLSLETVPSPLTQDDVIAIKTLYEELRGICSRARERKVAVVIDAEHSWCSAIDALTLALTREFNQPSAGTSEPLVYGTYQSYLRRGIDHLRTSLSDARKEGYILGVKLVRGAYHTLEISTHAKGMRDGAGNEVEVPPVWTQRSETDATYNTSCDAVLNGLVHRGLAVRRETEGGVRIYVTREVADRVSFGQLMGMRDGLTQYLADTVVTQVPIVLKYVPYGSLQEVIPYLARRAIENKSILGGDEGAANERRIVGAALRRRMFPFYDSISPGSPAA
ncbi:hypothetical protein BS47DRAFT_1373974 [Hydnum rufescens UP504]|uniref:Proline dehydrogenase n=1 Tax=Hydnum rufescens UP504 TaxID=1448309 RepID=A0A9P6AJR8_9AGAM|nr:hypothetical protein BS47DRAFT_1373974 [Hydnum rufescens UP504]